MVTPVIRIVTVLTFYTGFLTGKLFVAVGRRDITVIIIMIVIFLIFILLVFLRIFIAS